jgi:hypothetical protein
LPNATGQDADQQLQFLQVHGSQRQPALVQPQPAAACVFSVFSILILLVRGKR